MTILEKAARQSEQLRQCKFHNLIYSVCEAITTVAALAIALAITLVITLTVTLLIAALAVTL